MIKKIKCDHIFYDIKPNNKEITEQDYLELNIEEIRNKYKKNTCNRKSTIWTTIIKSNKIHKKIM